MGGPVPHGQLSDPPFSHGLSLTSVNFRTATVQILAVLEGEYNFSRNEFSFNIDSGAPYPSGDSRGESILALARLQSAVAEFCVISGTARSSEIVWKREKGMEFELSPLKR